MKRNLIVASSFFIVGLISTALVTLSLLMSLIQKPELLNASRITGAVEKSLAMLEKKGNLIMATAGQPGLERLGALTAAIIDKAKQKGMPLIPVGMMDGGTREFKPVFTVNVNRTIKSGIPRRTPIQPDTHKPEKLEQLVYELLSLQRNLSGIEARRDLAARIVRLQQSDGGWSLEPGMPSDACATGQALFALQESKMLRAESPGSQKALDFLLKSQKEDGSWISPIAKVDSSGSATNDGDNKSQTSESETAQWASLALLESLPDKN